MEMPDGTAPGPAARDTSRMGADRLPLPTVTSDAPNSLI